MLIGVAIGDSNLVSSAKNGIVAQPRIGSQRRPAAGRRSCRTQLAAEEAFANGLYPLAVHACSAGAASAWCSSAAPRTRSNGLVRDAVTQAGGNLATVVAVREPLDLHGLARRGGRDPLRGAWRPIARSWCERFGELAGQAARQRRAAGRPRAAQPRARQLLSAFDGQLGKLEGLVVMRAEPAGMSPEQAQASAAFESGLLAGVDRGRGAAVGVELSSTEPSQVPWYKSQGISSVDDLDALAGQAALVYALAGSHGAFGIKSDAPTRCCRVGGRPARSQP